MIMKQKTLQVCFIDMQKIINGRIVSKKIETWEHQSNHKFPTKKHIRINMYVLDLKNERICKMDNKSLAKFLNTLKTKEFKKVWFFAYKKTCYRFY